MFTPVLVALTLLGWIIATTDQKDFGPIKFNFIRKNISCLPRDIYIFFGVGHLHCFISKDILSLPHLLQLANFYSTFRQPYWVWKLIFSPIYLLCDKKNQAFPGVNCECCRENIAFLQTQVYSKHSRLISHV